MFGQTCHLLVISKDKEEVGNFKKVLTELLKEDMEFYSASGMEEALLVLSEQVIDLIFLDINIGRKQGYELINALPAFCRPPVIFIADQQSIDPELLNYGILYYLWRPVKKELLQAALNRFGEEILRKRQEREMMHLMTHAVSFSGELSRLALPTKSAMELISVHQIVRCESDSNYTHIYTLSGAKYTLPKTLKEVEKSLAAFFFRIHRSHIVNLNMVRRINGKESIVEMINGSHLPVSEDRKKILMGQVKITLNQKEDGLMTEKRVG